MSSFGMLGASFLASWEILGPSWDERESMIPKAFFLNVCLLSMFSTNYLYLYVWVRRHLALFIGFKRAQQSTRSLASEVNADLCIKCSQLRHTALHPLAMASLRDVFELVSAESVLNLGIVGSVRLFAVSSWWNQLADAAWAALKVLRLTDHASTHVECYVHGVEGICVADCTLLQWSRLPVEQQLRWSAQKQTLILYVRTPGRIIGPTLWQPEYAVHFTSLNFLALIDVRVAYGDGGPLVDSFGDPGDIGELLPDADGQHFSMRYYDEGQQFSDAFIPESVRHLFVQCGFHHTHYISMRRRPQHPFPLYFEGRNIYSLAVHDLLAVSLEESNDEQFTQVSSLACLKTLSREAEVVGLLRVVKWCPGLQRLGFVVNNASWSATWFALAGGSSNQDHAPCLGHITTLVLGFETLHSLDVLDILKLIPRSVRLLFLRMETFLPAHVYLLKVKAVLQEQAHHAGMWVFLQDNGLYPWPDYTDPWSGWGGPHVDMFSPFMERSLWSEPMQLKDAMGLHRMIHMVV